MRRPVRISPSLAACLVLAGGLALIDRPAAALLLEADLNSPGDALLTIDTGSGLVWLDWTVAAGMSVNEVQAELLPGGDFDSFRYASNAEVTAFWDNAGIPDVPGITLANLASVQALIALLGVTFSNALVDAGSVGFTSDLSAGLRTEATLADRTPFDGFGQATLQTTMGFTDDTKEPSRGHALVREIPEPGTVLLLVAGLSGTALARRRIADPARS